jgi:hypothetical protein
MAIWQYSLLMIPEMAIINRYGNVPEYLNLDYEGRLHFYKHVYPNNPNAKSELEDAFMINWWESLQISSRDTKQKIDQLFSNPSWEGSNHWSWKGDKEKFEDHDMMLITENENVRSLSFRIDLRDSKIDFLSGVIQLCNEFNCILMNDAGKVIAANIDSVLKDIPHSNAAMFLENPEEYLRNFDKKKHL